MAGRLMIHPHDCGGVWTPGTPGRRTARHGIVDLDQQRRAQRDADESGALHHFAEPTYNLRRRPDDDPLIRTIWDTEKELEFYWYSVWYIRSTPVGEDPKYIRDAIRAALGSSFSWAGMTDTWTRLDGTPADCTCIVDVVESGQAYAVRGNPTRIQLPMYSIRESRQGGNWPSTIIHEGGHVTFAGHDMDHFDAPGDDYSGYAGIFDYGADRTDHVTETDANKVIRWRRGRTAPHLIHG